eukprot:TRINITY_DN48591_c0_g1_i1.p1 TRINITY_DN48591_c0_g1~~TRINITY_DN48591_c0_g1_i1.p1  ORF type:complete len:237 (-),score=48.75 TRINITY_DN48591_c0_g1_i1:102-812(-)
MRSPVAAAIVDDETQESLTRSLTELSEKVGEALGPFQQRLNAAHAQLAELTAEDWAALDAVELDKYGCAPRPLELTVELACRILGITPEKVLDREAQEDNPGELRRRDDYWSVAQRRIFARPTCLAAAVPNDASPMSVEIKARIKMFGPAFEFAASFLGCEGEEADDHGAGDEGDEAEEEEDGFTEVFSKFPRAAGRLCEWCFAVKAASEAQEKSKHDLSQMSDLQERIACSPRKR